MNILNRAFYRFMSMPEDLGPLRVRVRERCQDAGLRGTILLSPEGVNASLAGMESAVREVTSWLERELGVEPPFDVKDSWSRELPFGRMKVKLKKEIIPTGLPDLDPTRRTGARLQPRELKKWLDAGRDVLLVDTRNTYETAEGSFEGALDLRLRTFREFGSRLEEIRERAAERPVVMFCTGGIRCEKATALAVELGIPQVYQLEGGILRYFEECGKAHYRGECFVFDERVKVDPLTVSANTPE